jgi:hypothetical protein
MRSSEELRFGIIPGLVTLLAVVTGVTFFQRGSSPSGESQAVLDRSNDIASQMASAIPRLGSSRAAPDLLAEFLGISPIPSGILQSAWTARNGLNAAAARGGLPEKQALEAIDSVLGWLGGTGDTTGNESHILARIERNIALLEDYGAKAGNSNLAEVIPYLRGLIQQSPDPSLESPEVRYLWDEASRHGVSRVSFLIATIPDYVDSSSGWTADQNLDAIQRAAGALGYRFDRFFLPDWKSDVNGSRIDSNGRQHRSEPGVLLFRRAEEPPGSRVHLLISLLVTETATGGIQQEAFRRAARLVSEWSHAAQVREIAGAGADGTMLVLGPTFSGSSLSLRYALETLLRDAPGGAVKGVRIVTGSATNPGNRDLLTFGKVKFSATVHTDDDLLAALKKYLGRLNPEWADGNHLALLSESNTVYGSTFAQKGAAQKSAAEESSTEFRNAFKASFPLHISRLRGVAGAVSGSSTLPSETSRPGVAIGMQSPGAASDHVPCLAPQLTPAVVELTLANILGTIRRERITAVGIFTTDKRDFVFLAREIVRASPNVLLFTTEGDLLFVHPDFGSFVRGTIVASSYPLFGATQLMSNRHLAKTMRQQFPTMGVQGIYNAVLALLDANPPLIDYWPPASTEDRKWLPRISISVVGRDAIWPVVIEVADSTSTEPYTFAAAVPGEDPGDETAHAPVKPPPPAYILLALVTIAALVHGFSYTRNYGRLLFTHIRSAFARFRKKRGESAGKDAHLSQPTEDAEPAEEPVEIERCRFLLICVTVLGAAAFWMWNLFIISRSGRFPPPRGWWTLLVILFALLAAVGFVLTLADRLLLPVKMRGACSRHFWIALLTALLMGVPAVCAANALWDLYREVAGRPPYYAQLLLARTLSVDNWVSQAPFVLFTAAALYVWAFWHARQLAMDGESYKSETGLFRLLCGESRTGLSRETLASELAAVLASPWRRTRLPLLASAVLVAFAYGFVTWNAGYGIDGLAFSRFFWWATLLVVFLFVHSVSQTTHLVIMLSRALNALGAHPIAPAFQRIANKQLFNWSLSTKPTQAYRLLPLLGIARSLSTLLSKSERPEFASLKDDVKAGNLQAAGMSLQTEPSFAFLNSEAWAVLAAAGDRAQRLLENHFWHNPVRDAATQLFETAEELVALLVSFIIRDLLSRIVTGLSVGLSMVFLVLGSHLFCPFQGRHLFVWFDLSLAALLTVIGVAVLVRFDRDKILSWSWSTTPGRVNWTGGLVPRMALWVVITLLTVLAARFPELGENVTGWLDPLKKAIP